MAEQKPPPAAIMDDEIELKRFRKWLSKQKKDRDSEIQGEVDDDLEPIEQAKQRWLVAHCQSKTWREQAYLLIQHAEEALQTADRYVEEEQTWEHTFKERLSRGLQTAVQKMRDLMLTHSNAQNDPNAPQEHIEEVGCQLRGMKDRLDRLSQIKDYKPVSNVRDIPLGDLPVVSLEEVRKEPPPIDKTNQVELDKYFAQRYCAACHKAKLASYHPLCLGCQQKLKSGNLDASWAGITLSSAPKNSVS